MFFIKPKTNLITHCHWIIPSSKFLWLTVLWNNTRVIWFKILIHYGESHFHHHFPNSTLFNGFEQRGYRREFDNIFNKLEIKWNLCFFRAYQLQTLESCMNAIQPTVHLFVWERVKRARFVAKDQILVFVHHPEKTWLMNPVLMKMNPNNMIKEIKKNKLI